MILAPSLCQAPEHQDLPRGTSTHTCALAFVWGPGHTPWSSAHETVSRTDHMLGHKTGLNKFKKTDILASIFLDHNDMKVEINHKKKTGKFTNTCGLNNMLLNNPWGKAKTKREILKIP